MRDEMPHDRAAMDSLLDRVDELHSIPQVAISVLNLTRDIDYDVREVVACLENDPALAAKILRTINSSSYALRRPIGSLQQAVALLGQRALRLVAMTFSLVDGLARGSGGDFCLDFWQRSLSTASIASRIARKSKQLDHNDAYAAGLLADLGILIFAQVQGEEYLKLTRKIPHGEQLINAEQLAFGCSHAGLSGQLLTRWGFPDSMVEATRHHHDDLTSGPPLYDVTRAGCLLADLLWKPNPARLAAGRALLENRFDFNVDDLIDLMIAVKEDIAFNAGMFGITLAQEIDLDAIRELARNQHQSALETMETEFHDDAANPTSEKFASSAGGKNRHLGTNVIKVFRDCDPMRTEIVAEFDDISQSSLTLKLPLPLGTYERVQIHIENAVQGFSCELRGIIRSSEGVDGMGCRAEIELLRRLNTFDLTALDNAGLRDKPIDGPVWM